MVQNHPMTSYRSSAEGKVTSSKGVRRITEPSSSPGDTRGVSSYPSDCCHTLAGGKKEKKNFLGRSTMSVIIIYFTNPAVFSNF